MVYWARMGGAFLGLVLWLAPLAASGAETPVLTLKQLTVMALEYSHEVKATKSEVTLAQEQKNEVHGYRWPQFDALASGGVIPNARRGEVRQVGENKTLFYPDPKDKLHGMNVFGNLTFSLVQPLYTFGKIAYRESAAAKNIEVKKAGVDLKKGEVMVQVAQAYYGLILANQGKEAVADARTYLRDARERVTRLLRVNSPNVKESDQYRLAMYEGGVEKFAAQADEGSKVAYLALKALVGYGPSQDFRVPQELPAPTAPRRPGPLHPRWPWSCGPNSPSSRAAWWPGNCWWTRPRPTAIRRSSWRWWARWPAPRAGITTPILMSTTFLMTMAPCPWWGPSGTLISAS